MFVVFEEILKCERNSRVIFRDMVLALQRAHYKCPQIIIGTPRLAFIVIA